MTEKTKAKSKPKTKAKSEEGTIYVALTGLNYGDPEKRVEPGEEVGDLPAESIDWLLEQGHIKAKEAE
jgi:hypothetical protein